MGHFFRRYHTRITLEDYRPRLYRLAYAWTRNVALAEDLAQETLMKAWRKRAQLRDAAAGRAWLFSILANCHMDHLRRHQEMEDIDTLPLIDESSPEIEADRRTVIGRVRAAVAALPAGQRQIITLVDLEGLSYVEVANILNVPVGTVMSRLCRARRALRQVLLVTSDGSDDRTQPGLWRVK